MHEDILILNMSSLIFSIFLGATLFVAALYLFTIRKSKQYRKEIMDMYVAAKTKVLAKADGLNLDEEYESFKRWMKKKRMEDSNLDLDDTIEEELKEKIRQEKTSKK